MVLKVIAAITMPFFGLGLVMIFPGMLGALLLPMDICLYVYCLFTWQSPFNFWECSGIFLPIYAMAGIHLLIVNKADLEIGYPLD